MAFCLAFQGLILLSSSNGVFSSWKGKSERGFENDILFRSNIRATTN